MLMGERMRICQCSPQLGAAVARAIPGQSKVILRVLLLELVNFVILLRLVGQALLRAREPPLKAGGRARCD